MQISPRFTVGDWKALDLSKSSDWRRAVQILEDRLNARSFDAVEAILSWEGGTQILTYLGTVENLHTSDFPGNNIKNEEIPFIREQPQISVTRAETALWLWFRVKRAADVIPARAPLEDTQARHLSRQFGFAFLDKEVGLRSRGGCQ